MKWMEFIKVQTTTSIVATKLLSFIEGCSQCSLCLRWDTDKPEPRGSSIGAYVSNSLKQYGLVDHSVWIEQEEQGEEGA